MTERHRHDFSADWTTAPDWTDDTASGPGNDAVIDAAGIYTATGNLLSISPINADSIGFNAGTELAITGVANNQVAVVPISNTGALGLSNAARGLDLTGDLAGGTGITGQTLSNGGPVATGNTGLVAATAYAYTTHKRPLRHCNPAPKRQR